MEFFVTVSNLPAYGSSRINYRTGPFSSFLEAKSSLEEEEKKDHRGTNVMCKIESSPIRTPKLWALEQLTVDKKYDPMWGGIVYNREVTTTTFKSRNRAAQECEMLNRKWTNLEIEPGKKCYFNPVEVCPHCKKWS